MIYLECNNTFIQTHITALAAQKRIPLVNDKKNKYFRNLLINFTKNKLNIIFQNKKFVIDLPVSINYLLHKIVEILNDLEISNELFKYFPFKQNIIFNNKLIILRNNHNIIFRNLLLAGPIEGINKLELYKNIWPNDKDIQINKLDTHLTNLKNYLLSEGGFNLTIKSENNQTRMLIN